MVRKGVEPKANTVIEFDGRVSVTRRRRGSTAARWPSCFRSQLNETLREKLGGAYSPGMSVADAAVSRGQEYSITVQFNSSPENVEKLSKSVFALIDSLKTHGPSASDVAKVKEQLIRGARSGDQAERILGGQHSGSRSSRRTSPVYLARMMKCSRTSRLRRSSERRRNTSTSTTMRDSFCCRRMARRHREGDGGRGMGDEARRVRAWTAAAGIDVGCWVTSGPERAFAVRSGSTSRRAAERLACTTSALNAVPPKRAELAWS